MAVPTLITELSTTAASNAPAGSDSPIILDDIQRAHAAFIAQLRDRDSSFALTLLDDADAAAARATLGLKMLGFEQTWQMPTRVLDTNYQNTTGKPIMVTVSVNLAPSASFIAYVGATTVSYINAGRAVNPLADYAETGPVSVVIPDGYWYKIGTTGAAPIGSSWSELR